MRHFRFKSYDDGKQYFLHHASCELVLGCPPPTGEDFSSSQALLRHPLSQTSSQGPRTPATPLLVRPPCPVLTLII